MDTRLTALRSARHAPLLLACVGWTDDFQASTHLDTENRRSFGDCVGFAAACHITPLMLEPIPSL